MRQYLQLFTAGAVAQSSSDLTDTLLSVHGRVVIVYHSWMIRMDMHGLVLIASITQDVRETCLSLDKVYLWRWFKTSV